MSDTLIRLVGLGVMGRNLALNYLDHGVSVVGYDLNATTRDEVRQGTPLRVEDSLQTLLSVDSSCGERLVLLMVPAGEAVDQLLQQLIPLLSKGDCIVDAGNSFYQDSERRLQWAQEAGINFLGMGVSGGFEGARNGAAMMLGGGAACVQYAPLLSQAAAKGHNGGACFVNTGGGGGGHFVKMVHNGIEYGVMQLLGECYALLRSSYNLTQEEIAALFFSWNRGVLASYLMEISAKVIKKQVEGEYLIDQIVAVAGQNGTGIWTVRSALEYGVPVPVLSAAVNARQRAKQVQDVRCKQAPVRFSQQSLEWMEQGLTLAILSAYVQGMELMAVASEKEGWGLDLAAITRGWSGGCIIRSQMLIELEQGLISSTGPAHLLQLPPFNRWCSTYRDGLQQMVEQAQDSAQPVLALASALAWVDQRNSTGDAIRLIQAQRDCFGFHGFQQQGKDGLSHANWEV